MIKPIGDLDESIRAGDCTFTVIEKAINFLIEEHNKLVEEVRSLSKFTDHEDAYESVLNRSVIKYFEEVRDPNT